MVHYENNIERALMELNDPSRSNARGGEPIVYVIYQPEDFLEIRTMIDTVLIPKAEFYGFKPCVLSICDLFRQFIDHSELSDFWTMPDELNEDELYDSIRQEIERTDFFKNALLQKLGELSADSKSLLIIRDVELLHPFDMMGAIENKIYNNITVPTLVLYPGVAQGTARSFLNIYNQDGNYRSKNF